MNQILPHQVWLAPSQGDEHFRDVFDLGIKALVSVSAEEPAPAPPRDLICCRFPLLDGAGNRPDLLYLATSTVATLVKLHIPTLVYGAGASRAPALAAAALAMVLQKPPEECLEQVARSYPCDVSPGFWSEVTGLLPAVR
jgi:hypothetical protein